MNPINPTNQINRINPDWSELLHIPITLDLTPDTQKTAEQAIYMLYQQL